MTKLLSYRKVTNANLKVFYALKPALTAVFIQCAIGRQILINDNFLQGSIQTLPYHIKNTM